MKKPVHLRRQSEHLLVVWVQLGRGRTYRGSAEDQRYYWSMSVSHCREFAVWNAASSHLVFRDCSIGGILVIRSVETLHTYVMLPVHPAMHGGRRVVLGRPMMSSGRRRRPDRRSGVLEGTNDERFRPQIGHGV